MARIIEIEHDMYIVSFTNSSVILKHFFENELKEMFKYTHQEFCDSFFTSFDSINSIKESFESATEKTIRTFLTSMFKPVKSKETEIKIYSSIQQICGEVQKKEFYNDGYLAPQFGFGTDVSVFHNDNNIITILFEFGVMSGFRPPQFFTFDSKFFRILLGLESNYDVNPSRIVSTLGDLLTEKLISYYLNQNSKSTDKFKAAIKTFNRRLRIESLGKVN